MDPAWETYEGTLTIDPPDGFHECQAEFTVVSEWDMGKRADWSRCTLDRWWFYDREQTRATAAALMGEDALRAAEEAAGEAWAETVRFAA